MSELSGKMKKIDSDLQGIKAQVFEQTNKILNIVDILKDKARQSDEKEMSNLLSAVESHVQYLKGYCQ